MADQNNNSQETIGAFAIKVEKLLCDAIGRRWSVCGMSIESLVAELAAKASSVAPAVPAVESLPRYEPHEQIMGFMQDSGAGEYVRLADVQALLATPSTAPDRHPLADENGCWGLYAESVLAAAPEATSEQMGGAQVASELETALTVFDMGLGFALCHRDFGSTRAAIKKLQADFEAIRAMIAAPTTDSAAAPADLYGAISSVLLSGTKLRGHTIGAVSTQLISVFNEFAKPPAAEGGATERKPLTDEQVIELLLDGILIDSGAEMLREGNQIAFSLEELTDFANKVREQHHGITGGGK